LEIGRRSSAAAATCCLACNVAVVHFAALSHHEFDKVGLVGRRRDVEYGSAAIVSDREVDRAVDPQREQDLAAAEHNSVVEACVAIRVGQRAGNIIERQNHQNLERPAQAKCVTWRPRSSVALQSADPASRKQKQGADEKYVPAQSSEAPCDTT
jgi:hypothetical protein